MNILGTRNYDCEIFSDCVRMLKCHYCWVNSDPVLSFHLDTILKYLEVLSPSPCFEEDISETVVAYLGDENQVD